MAKRRLMPLLCIVVVALIVLAVTLEMAFMKLQQPEVVNDETTIMWCMANSTDEDERLQEILMEDLKLYPEYMACKEKRIGFVHLYEVYYKATGVWYSWKTIKLR